MKYVLITVSDDEMCISKYRGFITMNDKLINSQIFMGNSSIAVMVYEEDESKDFYNTLNCLNFTDAEVLSEDITSVVDSI